MQIEHEPSSRPEAGHADLETSTRGEGQQLPFPHLNVTMLSIVSEATLRRARPRHLQTKRRNSETEGSPRIKAASTAGLLHPECRLVAHGPSFRSAEEIWSLSEHSRTCWLAAHPVANDGAAPAPSLLIQIKPDSSQRLEAERWISAWATPNAL
jgi:hypothetical protein